MLVGPVADQDPVHLLATFTAYVREQWTADLLAVPLALVFPECKRFV
jgi:hypothetical protein